jgi:agmatinase
MNEHVPNNFGGLAEQFSQYENSKVVILPVIYDKTSTWGKGSDKGPDAIINASRNLELYDIETDSEVYKKGIFTAEAIRPGDADSMIKKVYERVKEYVNDTKFVILLGGEHTISLGGIKAYAESYCDLCILHLDAHTDRRDIYEGNRYSHACVIARANEIVERVISIGIRSMDSSEKKHIDKKLIFFAKDIHVSKNWIKRAVKSISKNVYITIDLDVFDPGVMPSTGTPEPGGVSWYQCLTLLREVARRRNIVGFDVVELCPTDNKAPDFLAAKLIYKILSYVFINYNDDVKKI